MAVMLAATVLAACGPATVKDMQKPAPAVTFVTIKGEQVPVNVLRGKVLLVNFWATDCPVCLREMPQLTATHKKYQAQGLETVAVAMWHDPPIRVVDYAEKNALPFKVAFDPVGEHARAFGDITLTPTTFVIDKRGVIVFRVAGAPDFAKLHALLEKKLAEAL
jgi:peroxiredoxin